MSNVKSEPDTDQDFTGYIHFCLPMTVCIYGADVAIV